MVSELKSSLKNLPVLGRFETDSGPVPSDYHCELPKSHVPDEGVSIEENHFFDLLVVLGLKVETLVAPVRLSETVV